MRSLLKATGKRGSALVSVLLVCFVLLLFVAVISQEMTNYLSLARSSLATSTAEQYQTALWESLSASYYNEVFATRTQSGSTMFTDTQAGNVVANAASRLGAVGANGSEFKIPTTVGGAIYATVNASLPDGDFDAAVPNDFTSITNTFSWLDGVNASQRPITCVVRMRSVSAYGGVAYTTVSTNLFLFCQIPARNLPLSSLGALNVNDSLNSAVQGTTYVAGALSGGGGFDVSGGFVSGDASASTIKQDGAGVNLVGSGWQYRGYTEIAKQGNVTRNLDQQRAAALGVPIRPDYVFREGLAEAAGSPQEAAMYQALQPYYSTPASCRFFGVHNPNGTTPAQLFNLDGGTGSDTRATSFPAWVSVTNNVDAANVNRVTFTIDPLLAPADASGNVRIFVGSRLLNSSGDFANFRVLLKPAKSLPAGVQSFTIITPNDLVFLGDFNTPTAGSAIPTSIYASKVFFGTVQMSQVDFEGSFSHLNTSSTPSTLDMAAAGGTTPLAHNLNLHASSMNRTQTTGADLYYYVVLRRRP
jgi:hypothetical protein